MSWKSSTIGDVLSVIKNGINCEQNKIPVGDKITRIETIAKQVFDFERVGYATLTDSEKERGRVRRGDILFSHINSPIHVGKTAIYESDEDLYHGINLLLMRTVDDVDPYFFNHFLRHLFQIGYWERNCKKSVNQASVNQKDISRVDFSYPPLPIQQKIVAKLDAIFAEIDKATAAAEANANNAEILFQSYLTELFERGGEEWDEKTISEVADLIDSLHKTPKYVEDGFPMVRVTDIKIGPLNLSKTKKVDELTFNEFSKRHTPRIGDIVFSRVGSYGVSSIVKTEEKFCLGQNTVFILPKIRPQFLYYFLNSPIAKKQYDALIDGVTQPTISLKSIRQVRLKIPPEKMQTELVEEIDLFFENKEKMIYSYMHKKGLMNKLKNSILQQAFKGELVKD